MQIIEWRDITEKKNQERIAASIAIGVFDGLHLGHQKLIEAVKKNSYQAAPVIITFKNNPSSVMNKDNFSGNINSLSQKLKNFKVSGIDYVVLIDFSLEFSKITGREFWNHLLHRFDIKKVVVGENFHFGYRRDTNAVNLSSLCKGCELDVIQSQEYQERVVSSSYIRQLLIKGQFETANRLLNRKYALDLSILIKNKGTAIPGDQFEQLLPASGFYKVEYTYDEAVIPGLLEINKDLIRFTEPENLDLKRMNEVIFIEKADERSSACQ